MSDDNTQAFLNTRNIDPELSNDNLRFKAAQQDQSSQSYYDEAKQILAGAAGIENLDSGPGRVANWMMNLPRNIGVGAYRAVVNTVETMVDFERKWAEGEINAMKGNKPGAGKIDNPVKIPTLAESHPELMQSINGLADEWSATNKVEDDITQGVTQFTVPFTGWLKLMGKASVAKAFVAEAATSATAYTPHEGRVADLVQMGKQLDNKFGDVLRSATPDGSAVNAYINYMTNRENESDAEGRFKNVVDNAVTSAALAAFIKTAGVTLKSAKNQINPKPEGEK